MINGFLRTLAFAATILLIAGHASAQVSNPKQSYESLKVTTLITILTELGVAAEMSMLDDGSFLVSVPSEGGNVMLISLDKCAGPFSSGCPDMLLITVSRTIGLPYSDLLTNLAAVNLINEAIPLGKMVISDGAPFAVRYEHFGFGITKGGLVNDLAMAATAANNGYKVLQGLALEAAASTGMSAPDLPQDGGLLSANETAPEGMMLSKALREYLKSGQHLQSSVLFAGTGKEIGEISGALLKRMPVQD